MGYNVKIWSLVDREDGKSSPGRRRRRQRGGGRQGGEEALGRLPEISNRVNFVHMEQSVPIKGKRIFILKLSAHNAQDFLYNKLSSNKNGIKKKIIEINIEKCFDRINHNTIMNKLIAPRELKQGRRC